MADAFVSVAQLMARLKSTEIDTAEAIDAIEAATAKIQLMTGQRLVAVTNETITLPNRNGSSVWLPERPVTAVGAVTTTDERGVVTARVLNTDYYVLGAQIRWYSWVDSVAVTVTYSHGYATIPYGLQQKCLDIAARIYANPNGLQSETIGSYSWSMGGSDSGGPEVTAGDRDELTAYSAVPSTA